MTPGTDERDAVGDRSFADVSQRLDHVLHVNVHQQHHEGKRTLQALDAGQDVLGVQQVVPVAQNVMHSRTSKECLQQHQQQHEGKCRLQALDAGQDVLRVEQALHAGQDILGVEQVVPAAPGRYQSSDMGQTAVNAPEACSRKRIGRAVQCRCYCSNHRP